ncbi:YadA family autotransporter adhesin [Avibacterium avium]|uniref:YadA family autotransporter adhesin n=1 Tax=Avibacterium avium TaxID=751 RepID=UPI003BF7F510
MGRASFAAGQGAKTENQATVAIGENAKATLANNVSLGSGARDRQAVQINDATVQGISYSGFAGKAKAVVSVGTKAGERQIINVAPGEISENSTDAINGSQLYVVADKLSNAVNNIANATNGGGFILTDDSKTEVKQDLGKSIQLKGEKGITVTANAADKQLKIALGNEITVGNPEDPSNPAAPKEAGTINVVGKDGKNGVSIKGDTGNEKPGISIAGKDGADGVTLTTKTDGTPGVNGDATKPRLEVNNEEVATLNDGLKFAGDKGNTIIKKLNETVTIKGNLDKDATVTDKNLRVDSENGELVIKMAKVLQDLTSVATGDTLMNNDGVTINNGKAGKPVKLTKEGLNNGGNKITNVAAGTAPTDAVNVSQLEKAQKAATTKVVESKNIKVTETANADGSKTYKVATADDLDVNSVTAGDTVLNEDGVKAGNTVLNKDGVKVGDNVALTKDGLKVGDVNISTNGINAGDKKVTGVADGDISATSKDAVNGGQLYNTIQQTVKAVKIEVKEGDNIVITSDVGSDGQTIYTVSTVKDVKFDSAKIGNKVTINNNGIDAGDTKVTGVKAGDVSKDSTDAVNGSQLHETNQNVAKNATNIANNTAAIKKGLNFTADDGKTLNRQLGDTVAVNGDENITTSVTSSGVKVALNKKLKVDSVTAGNTVVNNDGVIIGTGDKAVSLTQNGLNNGGNRITNVAPGKDPTDAVNVAQLSNVTNHLDNKVNKVASDMKHMDKKLRAGIAGAAALGVLAQPTRPGKSMVSVGGTTYRDESAVALGVSRVSDNEKWVIKIGASANTRNNYIAGGSVGYQW